MNKNVRKVIAITLAVLSSVTEPLTVLAASPGAGMSPGGGGVVGGTNHTWPGHGIRVSLGEMSMVENYGIYGFDHTPTNDELTEQMNDIGRIAEHQMWRTDFGATVLDGAEGFRTDSPVVGIWDSMSWYPSGKIPTIVSSNAVLDKKPAAELNQIAYQANIGNKDGHVVYDEPWKFKQDTYDLCFWERGRELALANPEEWLNTIWSTVYGSESMSKAKDIVATLTDCKNGRSVQNWNYFTWTTFMPEGLDTWEDQPQEHLRWNNLGLYTGAMYLFIGITF